MTNLIVYTDVIAPAAPTEEIVFGGQATVNLESDYPVCRECGETMLFLGQIPSLRDPFGSFIALFQCSSEDGLCDTWEADGGANAAVRVKRDETLLPAPAFEETTTGTTSLYRYSGALQELTQPYNDARKAYAESADKSGRHILGYIGGEPEWIQGDESPTCDVDGTTMDFVALIEEGIIPEGSRSTIANFGGGGAAYVFECEHQTKYLWQQ